MSARRTFLAVLAALSIGLALAGPAVAAEGISVAIDRTNVATALGDNFVFRTTIKNSRAAATPPLIAHLNLLSFRDGVYVDPEDWSTARTRYLGTIPAGGSQTLSWRIHAVNVGSFAAYITVIRQDRPGQTATTGAVLRAEVAKRKGFDSGGISALALGIPLLLGLLTVGARLRTRIQR
jgi:hypothetical protein